MVFLVVVEAASMEEYYNGVCAAVKAAVLAMLKVLHEFSVAPFVFVTISMVTHFSITDNQSGQ